MITPEELKLQGWKNIAWNGGIIQEYWKPIFPKRGQDVRLAVRFNEHQDYPVMVYIIMPQTALGLKHITTINELNALYALLKQPL